MILRDYHLHTYYSDDSNIPMERMIQSAIQKGMTEIALTDHVDFDFPDNETAFLIDYDKYTQEFFRLKEKYAGEIQLLLGVEIGLQPHLENAIQNLLQQYPFDFVIGSIHSVQRMDIYRMDYHRKLGSKEKAYRTYFEDVLTCAGMTNCYDVFGHIDYVNRYGGYSDKILLYEDYKDILDPILQKIIQGGKGLEINTSGYRYGLGQTHPQKSILQKYIQMGGSILTTGSDSHREQDIGSHFNLVEDMLLDLSVNQLTGFSKRTPQQYNIK